VTYLPHISSVFNGPPAARLAKVRSSPWCVVPWKIHMCAPPMEIMMTGSSGDICLIGCSLQSPSSGHVVAPELSWARRWEPEPWGGTWQPCSWLEPPEHVATPELSLAGRRVLEPRGHVAASELPPAGRWKPEPLSWLKAFTRRYPVLRVPTRALIDRTHDGWLGRLTGW
jgi:hypothetical protein